MERINIWKGKKVFVTGSTGVVGLNLVSELENYGAEVVALVRDWVPKTRILGKWLSDRSDVIQVRGSLEDRNLIQRTLAEYETECIFHLGAQTIVHVGNRSPLTTFRANIEGTWNLLDAARDLNTYSPDIRAICIASSDKAYGTSLNLPYTEDMPLAGEHPYDVSKSCTDLIARSFGVTYGLPVSIARMGNIYGPGDLNFNRIVPGTIQRILQGKSPQIRSDGTPIREYFYVKDAVDAYLTMGEKTMNETYKGEAFNFSSGERLNVIDLVKRIAFLMNDKSQPEILGTGRHEIQDQYLSIEKAEKILEWKPHYSIEDGLKETISWYRGVLQ